MVLAEGFPINTTGGPHFTDVPTTNPFYVFIETAYNRGLISGYSDGTFRSGQQRHPWAAMQDSSASPKGGP